MKKIKTQIDLITVMILLCVAACLFIGFLAFHSFFTFEEIKNTDIKQVKGTVNQSYLTGGKVKNLVLKLKEYPQEFHVSSVQLKALNNNDFKFNVFSGDQISLSILNEDFEMLLTNSHTQSKIIQVYSVSSEDKEYLSIEEYNKSEKSNVRVGFVVGSIFTAIGALILTFFIKVMIK